MEEEKIRLSEYCSAAGCGCKISSDVLGTILFSGKKMDQSKKIYVDNSNFDDAAAIEINEKELLLSTADFFTPIVDDAFEFGRIAAANSVSDIYAMGGYPVMALSILGWPLSKLSAGIASEVIQGAEALCSTIELSISGGHSIESPEPFFGLSVNGLVEKNRLKKNRGALPGDKIFLTKPLGAGILATAVKKKIIEMIDYQNLLKSLTRVNSIGRVLSQFEKVHCMTDVTGFGLCGHLIEVCRGSNVTANIFFDQIPVMSNLQHYISAGSVPGGTSKNRRSFSYYVQKKDIHIDEILYDPQTNGGILLFCSPDLELEVSRLLEDENLHFNVVGEVLPVSECFVKVI